MSSSCYPNNKLDDLKILFRYHKMKLYEVKYNFIVAKIYISLYRLIDSISITTKNCGILRFEVYLQLQICDNIIIYWGVEIFFPLSIVHLNANQFSVMSFCIPPFYSYSINPSFLQQRSQTFLKFSYRYVPYLFY